MDIKEIRTKQAEVVVYLQERIKVSSIVDSDMPGLVHALATAIESLHGLDHWRDNEKD